MKPLSAKLTVYQNASFRQDVALKRDGAALNDLSGWTFKAEVRAASDSGLLATFLTSTSGGVVTLRLKPEQTAQLTDDAEWDLIGRDAEGEVWRVAEGTIALKPGVTELPVI